MPFWHGPFWRIGEAMDSKILIVDEDRAFGEALARQIGELGYRRQRLETDPFRAAETVAAGEPFELAIIDMALPGMDGLELLGRIKSHSPNTECIVVTAINDAQLAVECLKAGAYDYLVKPVSKNALALSVRRAVERKRLKDIIAFDKSERLWEDSRRGPFKTIVTRCRKMLRVLMEAKLHAASDVPVLITGESGTGKELLARAIHGASPRATHLFTPVDVAAVSAGLFEAEFFGHTKGAFTGADSHRQGYLEHTHRGTLFLDEIGNLPEPLQAKLLRVLQDGEFTKLGSSRSQRVDIRIIAATNADLDRMLAANTFRKDLYYRISGGWLHLPPLRERKEDIPLLIRHFLDRHGVTAGEGPPPVADGALDRLAAYQFPGNVRELQTVIQSAVNLSQGGPISMRHLPDHIASLPVPVAPTAPECQADGGIRPLAEVERDHILRVYRRLGGNKSKTARLLGIGLNTLRRKLGAYGIN
jgi:DNA-binding NtrC family response regulator